MIYILVLINIVLISLSGLAVFNIHYLGKSGWLEITVLMISLFFVFCSNIGIIFLSVKRGKESKEIKKRVAQLEELNSDKNNNE
ncbi:MAG: hypothetical protein B6226_02305 [Candidatus Cloacimonetes bacterium 4572_65]|nr:MAG: hypothetical protein B6226_02305 [Candidatus Cloacimonetes bacterium 4572_65]